MWERITQIDRDPWTIKHNIKRKKRGLVYCCNHLSKLCTTL
jgi:hypothetical protein